MLIASIKDSYKVGMEGSTGNKEEEGYRDKRRNKKEDVNRNSSGRKEIKPGSECELNKEVGLMDNEEKIVLEDEGIKRGRCENRREVKNQQPETEEVIVTEEEGGADKVGINGQMNVTRERMGTRFNRIERDESSIRTDINEGGIRRKGPSGVAYRFEVRRQSGCSAAVRKKRTSVGVSPAKSYVNVNKGGLASKGKLWAGLDQEEEHMRNWSSKDLKEQGSEKEWEYNEEGK